MKHLNASRGFIEHGHLYGAYALIVNCDNADAARDMPPVLLRERVHFIINSPAAAVLAGDLAREVGKRGNPMSASVRAGVTINYSTLAYESVLVYGSTDHILETHLLDGSEHSVSSVSVHGWQGSGVLDTLERQFEAHRGRFLVLPPDDIGDAKVWLTATRNPRWKIIPAYPFNRAENAELLEMSR